MSTTIIEKRVLNWPVPKKVALAEKILASVQNFADGHTEAAWKAEIAKRVKEIEAGEAVAVPAKEVLAKARDTLREARRLS